MTRLFILILLFGVSAVPARSSEIQSIGVPYVQNYLKASYQAGNQNWAITKDEHGILYFGNNEGLLAFDGRYWQTYRMPNRVIVRSVAADGKGKIYAGGFGEFGYWSYNKKGKFVFTSLTSLIPPKYRMYGEIWKIYIIGGKVIFQSFATIFIYERGKVSAVKAKNPFLFLFSCRNRVFVEVIDQGLFELKGLSLRYIEGSSELQSGILTILPFDQASFLIGTSKHGLFIFDGDGIRPWVNQANSFLKTYQLNNGALVLGKYFAFGTILNGIVLVDRNGSLVQWINKGSGLQNNTILSLFTDKEQNLWAGLDNGIDRIEISSALYFYFDKAGKFGTVYASIIYQGRIYLGTNQGLFYSNWLQDKQNKVLQPFDFKLIPGSQGQVWDLSLLDGQLLCGHNEGTFLVNGTSIRKISSVNGGWMIGKLANSDGRVMQGTYTGLVIFQKTGTGSWKFSHKVTGFGEPSRYVVQDQKGKIWVSHAYKGLYKLSLDKDMKRVTGSRLYGKSSGLPGSYHINSFNFDGRIIFSSDSGFYVYDDLDDRFVKYHTLNKKLGSYQVSNKVIAASDTRYWFFNGGKLALVTATDAGKLSIDSTSFGVLNGRMVDDYQNVSRISNSLYLISIDDGFVIFNKGITPNNSLFIPPVMIRKVENTTARISLLAETAVSSIRLPSRSSIRISYSLPFYSQIPVKYQFYLEGYSQGWSEWTQQTQKEFTNLSPGNYEFRVRAMINGNRVTGIANLHFVIDTPWFAGIWALLFYILLALIIAWLIRKYSRKRFLSHQKDLELKLLAEKEEQLRKEALVNEQKIIRIRNEQLQAELESKSRELTNSAMNIVYKNELLQKLSEEIHQLKDDSGKKLSEDRLKKIQKVISDGMTDERDWNLFENSFNETHESFFKKLKTDHPELVPNDLKLCAYLRMNMSSKEIASLLNITLRGVEIRRYRLRKKLNIPPSKILVEFLMEL